MWAEFCAEGHYVEVSECGSHLCVDIGVHPDDRHVPDLVCMSGPVCVGSCVPVRSWMWQKGWCV